MQKEKCTNWKRYKAVKKPTCGCKMCYMKYMTKLGKDLNKEKVN